MQKITAGAVDTRHGFTNRDGLNMRVALPFIALVFFMAFLSTAHGEGAATGYSPEIIAGLPLVTQADGGKIAVRAGIPASDESGACVCAIFNNGNSSVFSYDYAGHVTSFFLSDRNNILVTVWATGSAYRVIVFKIEKTGVVQIKTEGSKRFPSIVHISDGWAFFCPRFETTGVFVIDFEGNLIVDGMECKSEDVDKKAAEMVACCADARPAK